jgi:peptidyl-prolyl cis-trans isomerase C
VLTRFRMSIAFAIMLALAGCSNVTGTGDPTAAATVNDERIEVSEVEAQYALSTSGDRPDPDAEQSAALQSSALQYLLRLTLLEQGAADLGIEFTDEDMEQAREDFAAQFGGPEALEAALEEEGLELSDLDAQLKSQWLEMAIGEALADDVEVSEEDVRAAYERQYAALPTVRHILLETEDEAQEVVDELDDGADFNELAAERSIDPSAEQNAGELGQLQLGQTVEPFEDAAFGAEVGEIVGPVESDFGFHVIEVTDVQETEAPPFEEVEEQIRRELVSQQGGQERFLDWIRGVAADADVEVNPRFGEWDESGIAVVPASALDRESPVDR